MPEILFVSKNRLRLLCSSRSEDYILMPFTAVSQASWRASDATFRHMQQLLVRWQAASRLHKLNTALRERSNKARIQELASNQNLTGGFWKGKGMPSLISNGVQRKASI